MEQEQVMEFLKALVILVWEFDGVKVIVGHTAINVAVAVAAAVKVGDFQLGKLAEFLTRKLLPYVAVYFVVKAFGDAAGVGLLAPMVWTLIEATLTGDLLDNWDKLGLPLPDKVRGLVTKMPF